MLTDSDPVRDPRVLVVEPDASFGYQLVEALGASDDVFEIEIVHLLRDAQERASQEEYDLLLVDLHGASAQHSSPTLQLLQKTTQASLIVLGNRPADQEADAALAAGAETYVVKGVDGLSGVVRALRVALERRSARRLLRQQAYRDPLTKLHNRASFQDTLHERLHSGGAHGSLALFFIDLDGFKSINDSYGHVVGDRVLRVLGQRLRTEIDGVFVARIGGDEFALLVDPVVSLEHALMVAEQVVALVEKPIHSARASLCVGCRIGVAITPLSGTTATELLTGADQAMYAAKHQGGRIRVHLPDGLPQWEPNAPRHTPVPVTERQLS